MLLFFPGKLHESQIIFPIPGWCVSRHPDYALLNYVLHDDVKTLRPGGSDPVTIRLGVGVRQVLHLVS